MFEYQWLDCYVPGRLVIASRIPEASRYCAVMIQAYLMLTRIIMLQRNSRFNTLCFEIFKLHHATLKQMIGKKLLSIAIIEQFLSKLFEIDRNYSNDFKEPEQSSFDDHFINHLSTCQVIKRPYRTMRQRQIYACIHCFGILFASGGLSMAIVFYSFMNGPMWITRRGFGLTYRGCVNFITTQISEEDNQSSNNISIGLYDYIYQPDKSQSPDEMTERNSVILMPFEDFVPINTYHTIRVLFDISENVLYWFGMTLCQFYYLYFSIEFCLDANIYISSLISQVDSLKERLSLHLRKCNQQLQNGYDQVVQNNCVFYTEKINYFIKTDGNFPHVSWRNDQSHLSGLDERSQQSNKFFNDEIIRIQGSLVDYFQLINIYKPFINISIIANIFLLLLYTFIIFIRSLRPNRLRLFASLDNDVQAEFICLFLWCLIIVLILLASASFVDTRSRRLYRSISSLMIFDDGQRQTKKRWIIIVKHFYPESLNCFNILDHTRVSWLFDLKVSVILA